MAATKGSTAIWDGVSLGTGVGSASVAIDLSAGYGAQVHFGVINGATGPALGAEIQPKVSSDNSKFYEYGGAVVAGTIAQGTYNWSNEIPIGVSFLRLDAGSNTGQAVTINADITNVTGV